MSLAERLRATLASTPESPPVSDIADRETPLTPAAVLIAITDRPEPGVLLTVRHANLRKHAGQIAFPGGRADPEDATITDTALREAYEEIGLAPAEVEVVGTTDRYLTGTGFDITPVIGVVPPDLALVAQEDEVTDIFEVPLAFILATANHAHHTVEWQGRMRSYYEILWGERRIWGVTAGVIVALSKRLTAFA